jgi:putative glutamine amidotransferase
MDHRGGPGTLEQRYGPKHPIALSGELARIVGAEAIMVNSLHGQAIERPAPGLVVEALAADGTIEAVRVTTARGFAFGVQWHPEWGFRDNPASLAILGAFGAACRAYRLGTNRKAA